MKNIYLTLLKVYKKEKKLFFYSSFDIFTYIFYLLSINFNKKIINLIIKENSHFNDGLYLIILYSIFSFGLGDFLKYFRKNYYLICEKNNMNIVKNNFEYTIQHSKNYFDKNLSGNLTTAIVNSGNIFKFLCIIIRDIINSFITFIFLFIYCCKINIYIAIFMFFSTAFYFIRQKKISKIHSLIRSKISSKNSKYNGHIVDLFLNFLNVISFTNKFYETIKAKKQILDILKTENKDRKIKIKRQISFIISLMPTILLNILIVYLVYKKKINIDEFYVFKIMMYELIVSINFSIRQINEFNNLKETYLGYINKLYKPIEIIDNTNKKIKIINGNIVFKNINFNYEK